MAVPSGASQNFGPAAPIPAPAAPITQTPQETEIIYEKKIKDLFATVSKGLNHDQLVEIKALNNPEKIISKILDFSSLSDGEKIAQLQGIKTLADTLKLNKRLEEANSHIQSFFSQATSQLLLTQPLKAGEIPKNKSVNPIIELKNLIDKTPIDKLLEILRDKNHGFLIKNSEITASINDKIKLSTSKDTLKFYEEILIDEVLPEEIKMNLFEAIHNTPVPLYQNPGFFHYLDKIRPEGRTGAGFFSRCFRKLLIENPKYAKELLENPKYSLNTLPFEFWLMDCDKMTTGNDQKLADCLNILTNNNNINLDDLRGILRTAITFDMPNTVLAFIKNPRCPISNDEIMDLIVKWDSHESLKAISTELKDYLLSKEQEITNKVLNNSAANCLGIIKDLYKFNDEKIKEIATKYGGLGYIDMAINVCNGDRAKAAAFIFSNVTTPKTSLVDQFNKILSFSSDKALENLFKRMFRFSSIEEVHRLIIPFISQKTAAEKDIFMEAYDKAKTEFLKVAPFIARYKSPAQIETLKSMYDHGSTVTDKTQEELEYATLCRANCLKFATGLKDGTLVRPTQEQFSLPASSKNTQRAAALLEQIALARSARQKKWDSDLFRTKRTGGSLETPVDGLYSWGNPLVSSVLSLSKASDLKRYGTFYGLTYKEREVTQNGFGKWYHGLLDLKETWKDVEDTFEEILAMDLSKPKVNTSDSKRNYEERLTKFYEKCADLGWLIGNSTPLERGTGSVVEWMLGIVHLYHGLERPLLKHSFPHLDVLHISMPREDFRKLFVDFFEPETIPQHLRHDYLPDGLSLKKQTEVMYDRINQPQS